MIGLQVYIGYFGIGSFLHALSLSINYESRYSGTINYESDWFASIHWLCWNWLLFRCIITFWKLWKSVFSHEPTLICSADTWIVFTLPSKMFWKAFAISLFRDVWLIHKINFPIGRFCQGSLKQHLYWTS